MKKIVYILILLFITSVGIASNKNIHTIYSFAKSQSDTIFMLTVRNNEVIKINGFKNKEHLKKLNNELQNNLTNIIKL